MLSVVFCCYVVILNSYGMLLWWMNSVWWEWMLIWVNVPWFDFGFLVIVLIGLVMVGRWVSVDVMVVIIGSGRYIFVGWIVLLTYWSCVVKENLIGNVV